jgi:hypothetical protein
MQNYNEDLIFEDDIIDTDLEPCTHPKATVEKFDDNWFVCGECGEEVTEKDYEG